MSGRQSRTIQGNKGRRDAGIIIILMILLFAVTFANVFFTFQQNNRQTRSSGIYQLEAISGKLENSINQAQELTLELAAAARELVGDLPAMEKMIYEAGDDLRASSTGGFNVYIAGTDWDVLPGLVDRTGYDSKEREWYIGAARNPGKTYVSQPYVDVVTGDICYTVSVMLPDHDTVLGVDYSVESIQEHITSVYETGTKQAVIVTDEGVIAGCSDETLIGKRLDDVLPDYSGIYSLARGKSGVVTAKIRSGLLYNNLFAVESGHGWFLIVSQGDWELYKDSYLQMFATAGLSILLFATIVLLYFMASRSKKRAEEILNTKEEFLKHITEEFHDPLRRILDGSSKENAASIEDIGEEMSRIHTAGEKLSEMIRQMVSYSSIVRAEKGQKKEKKQIIKTGMNKRFRTLILGLLILTAVVSLYTNLSATYRWGNELMRSEVEHYEFRVSEWIDKQKGILDMFCSMISTNPEMLDDYEATVKTLDAITMQYPEISVTYMASPSREHTVYMNNGWEPDAGWRVEERTWYVNTLNSDDGWSISMPYYDEQTGGYCLTISERVNDAETGEFLGIFGIDFFMDKMIAILGDSYSDTGYAFLADTAGNIINHPYGSYQLSQDARVNVAELPYGRVRIDGQSTEIIRDYDDSLRILIAIRNPESRYSVYVLSNIWNIYGRVILYGIICLIVFLLCIFLVYRLLTDLIYWQNETNEQMKEAADTAIAAGKAKSQFLAQMSHEIRTPINAVLGMNEMILREATDQEILEYSANIQSAGRTLLSIINTILDFSKIEDGKMEIVPVRYETAFMINNLVNSIKERAKAKSLSFIVDADESLPCELYGDDVRVTQVISNLLTNAVKYTEEGSVTLSIRNGGIESGNVILDVSVKDTGIGIRKEDMGKLFESFERIDEQRNHNIEGTGLGMSIVTKLLTMMGSRLHVESEYGKGSAFSFQLSQSVENREPMGHYMDRLSRQGKDQNKAERLCAPDARVLVVDDNEMNRKVAASLLKLFEIGADLARSGPEAVEAMRRNHYDLVLLDHMMPGMDGIATLAIINEESLASRGTRIIALTANAVVGARDFYLKSGFDDYLAKPVGVRELEEILAKHLPGEKISYRSPDEEKKQSDDIMFFSPDDDGGEETNVQSAAPASGESIDFPAVEGLDWRFAREHLPMDDLLQETVRAFRDSISEQADQLDALYQAFPDETAVSDYRTLVHAMKSQAATIGIIPLAGMAKVLEDASAASQLERVERLHPVFMDVWCSYRDKLSTI
ncbi:MAG: response regulator [Lachnospiraceae bacterium]|nr:response regulator [Lachnospiraceae bacterium]